MHTKGKLQFLLSEVLNRSADFEMSLTRRREAAGWGKSEVSHTRRSNENSNKECLPGLLAKSRGLGLGLRVSKIRREAGIRQEIRASKLLRACGGCLGAKRR